MFSKGNVQHSENMLLLDFLLKNEHNCRITDVFKKNDKLMVVLNHMPIVYLLVKQ